MTSIALELFLSDFAFAYPTYLAFATPEGLDIALRLGLEALAHQFGDYKSGGHLRGPARPALRKLLQVHAKAPHLIFIVLWAQ